MCYGHFTIRGRYFVDRRWELETSLGYSGILKGFKVVSGLGNNFQKSKIIGININPHFLEMETSFLSCRSASKQLKFLIILIGSNPRRISTWRQLMGSIRKRLNNWKGMWLSFGERLTLLKLILSSLAIFTLSFDKAPKKILVEINKLQSSFLWGDRRRSGKFIGSVVKMFVFR